MNDEKWKEFEKIRQKRCCAAQELLLRAAALMFENAGDAAAFMTDEGCSDGVPEQWAAKGLAIEALTFPFPGDDDYWQRHTHAAAMALVRPPRNEEAAEGIRLRQGRA